MTHAGSPKSMMTESQLPRCQPLSLSACRVGSTSGAVGKRSRIRRFAPQASAAAAQRRHGLRPVDHDCAVERTSLENEPSRASIWPGNSHRIYPPQMPKRSRPARRGSRCYQPAGLPRSRTPQASRTSGSPRPTCCTPLHQRLHTNILSAPAKELVNSSNHAAGLIGL